MNFPGPQFPHLANGLMCSDLLAEKKYGDRVSDWTIIDEDDENVG